jgi:hypothetical protein
MPPCEKSVIISFRHAEAHSDAGRVCTLAEAERERTSEVVEMTNGLIAGNRVPQKLGINLKQVLDIHLLTLMPVKLLLKVCRCIFCTLQH